MNCLIKALDPGRVNINLMETYLTNVAAALADCHPTLPC